MGYNALIWRRLGFTGDTLWDINIQVASGVRNTDILIKGSNCHQSVNTDSVLYTWRQVTDQITLDYR